MTYTGLFLRQYMGQDISSIPNTTGNWFTSPDLLVYGTAPAYSTRNFNSRDEDYASRDYYFSQPPTPGSANYVYVRAKTLSPNLKSTLYLYYCEAAALLQPRNWQSGNFTVAVDTGAPVARNYFTLSADALGALLTSYDPVAQQGSLITWTPPAAGSAPHYYLIAWADNSSDGSNPPPFADLQPFSDLNTLGNYVQSNPNMVVLDTWYTGMFLRQYAGQTNYQPGSTAQGSPDLIVTGAVALADPTTYATPGAYASATLNQNVTLQMRNFIYPRVLNTSAVAKTARVYLYESTSDKLSPAGWQSGNFTVGGAPCNYVDITAQPGQVAVAQLPIVWRLDVPNPGTNYVLISYTDDSGSQDPPDFSIFGYVNSLMIEQFVATQPRIAWLQIDGARPTAVPDMSYEYPLTIAAGTYYTGLQFKGIPSGGTVTFSLPGSGAANTLVLQGMPVPDPNAAVTWPLTFPTALTTSLVLNYWANRSGGGGTGGGANISVALIPSTS